ncbi:MAG: IS21 family transposase [Saprospiraceae bacterium]|nr:IS21 family transposase [Saprospiraceae bacterium]
MANKTLEIMDLKYLLQLKVAGKSNRTISGLLGRSRNTVNEYVQLFEQSDKDLESLSKLTLSELHKMVSLLKTAAKEKQSAPSDTRYADLEKHQQTYLNDLKRPGATYQTIWREYKQSFPNGYGYTQFKLYLKQFTKQEEYSMPMQHKFGDKLFIDFTGKKLPVVDRATGEIQQMEVFVGILGASQYTYVEACPSQRLEDFIRCTTNCLAYMGGVPQAIVPDNLKSAVTKASNYEAILNRHYKSMAIHYSCVIYPTRAVKPQDKSLVEGAVRLAYQRIFYYLSKQIFFSLAELNEQIFKLLEKYNEQPFYQQTESRKDRFEREEKHLLSPLPPYGYEPKAVKRAKVQKNCHIWLEKHHYSVPHSYVGKQVKVHYNSRIVEVYFDYERIAMHKRSEQPWTYTTIKEHMPSAHQFVMDWNPDRFIRWGQKIGTDTGLYIEKVLTKKNYPEQGYKSCMGILSLAKKYNPLRLEKACHRALQYEKYSYQTIKRILELKMDQIEEESDTITLPKHDNIRGGEYYE